MGQNVLVVVGMHRSGTSLTARWLEQCGLSIGKRLVCPSAPYGLHEDPSFVSLHKAILRDNQTSHMLTQAAPLAVRGRFRQWGIELVANRAAQANWGWKDPRTCLFLGFWHDLLPEARYLVVFRHYARVVDSLHRRNRRCSLVRPAYYVPGECFDKYRSPFPRALVRRYAGFVERHPVASRRLRRFLTYPMRAIRSSVWNLPLTQLYARNWALYNRRILEFYLGHQASCLCLSIEQMVARGEQIIRYLNDAWEFSLTPKPMTSVFEPSRMKRSASTWEGMICEMLVPDVKRIYARLGAAEADTIPELAAHRGRA